MLKYRNIEKESKQTETVHTLDHRETKSNAHAQLCCSLWQSRTRKCVRLMWVCVGEKRAQFFYVLLSLSTMCRLVRNGQHLFLILSV